MSKELEYEINNFANLLHKDCMNLMECLKKQSEDNKPILYLGKHYEKVILPLEEYQKMCNRLESIDNAEPSEALECLEYIKSQSPICYDNDGKFYEFEKEFDTIKQALLKAQKDRKALEIIKEKRVNVDLFWNDFVDNGFGYHYYLEKWYKFQSTDNKKLTEEEFNLLKEVLE